MRRGAVTRIDRTEGERHATLAYIALGLVGAALSFLIALRIGRSSFMARGPDLYDLWLAVSGMAGACLALRYGAGRFGHPGTQGLRRALQGMVIVTLLAPVLAGTLVLPLYGTMFGPLALAVTFAGSPFVALIWFATLAGVHLLFLTLRLERETIFRAADRGKARA